jgi:hypothetical protein
VRSLLLAALLVSWGAGAAELALPGNLPELQIHGFVSQGFLFSSANNYLANSSKGSFEFSEVGLNFTMPATDRLRLGVQLFSRDLGPTGDYRAVLDWYYLDYHWNDWLGVRAGRVKVPFGLYNDSADIDSARTAVLLPQSVYPAESRDYLLAQTGVEVYGYSSIGGLGGLDYRLYTGTLFIEPPKPGSTPFTVLNYTVPWLAGGRLLWSPPLEGLRLGASVEILKLEGDLLGPAPIGKFAFTVPATLWVASAEYVVRDWLFAAEFSRWVVKLESSKPSVLPESSTTSQRAYALATYRINSWLQAGGYYSIYYPDFQHREGQDEMQLDGALTVRFDVNANWLIKLEGHYVHGTAALSPSLNRDQPLRSLQPDWALFAVKTTAYF